MARRVGVSSSKITLVTGWTAAERAGIDPQKAFPHNLRHLFARSYYSMDKDLARLADILGHSSIETTRIYVAAGVSLYEKTMRRMRLVL